MRKALVALLLASFLCLPYVSPAAAANKRPNVLLIMTDQQPMSTIGAYGNSQAKTPHIDRLAQQGMRFDNFHISAFACSPSRACYFTGVYPHHHGIVTNDIILSENLPGMGNLFKGAGYQTAFVGKWHLGGNMYVPSESDKFSHNRLPDDRNFRYGNDGPWRGGEDEAQCGFADKWVGGWAHYRNYLRQVGLGEFVEGRSRVGNHNVASSGPEGTHIYSRVPEQHHMSAFLAGEAEKFLRHQRKPNEPFCMVLSFYGPHLPVAPPKPWDAIFSADDVPLPDNHEDTLKNKPWAQQTNMRCYQGNKWTAQQYRDYIARYWGYCAYIDHQVGRVLKALDETGAADDTIVIFTTDHGDMVASHGFVFKLCSGYDELMRIPFIMRYPPLIGPGTSNDALVENIDVLPTLLDLSGVAIPKSLDGRSFRDVLTGKTTQFRDAVFTHMSNTIMVRTPDWKLVFSRGRNRKGSFVELYDMREKPLEVNNRAGNPAVAEVLASMKKRLSDWLDEYKHPYADAIREELATARTSTPSDDELVNPQVSSLKQVKDKKGAAAVELTIDWHAGAALSKTDKYWCFVHVLNPNGRKIVTRATAWPEPTTTDWTVGKTYEVGPLMLPIPQNLNGDYPIRIGLFSPQAQTRPNTYNEAQRIGGTLKVRKTGGEQTIEFVPGR